MSKFKRIAQEGFDYPDPTRYKNSEYMKLGPLNEMQQKEKFIPSQNLPSLSKLNQMTGMGNPDEFLGLDKLNSYYIRDTAIQYFDKLVDVPLQIFKNKESLTEIEEAWLDRLNKLLTHIAIHLIAIRQSPVLPINKEFEATQYFITEAGQELIILLFHLAYPTQINNQTSKEYGAIKNPNIRSKIIKTIEDLNQIMEGFIKWEDSVKIKLYGIGNNKQYEL